MTLKEIKDRWFGSWNSSSVDDKNSTKVRNQFTGINEDDYIGYIKNGQWVVGKLSEYKSHFYNEKISVNAHTLTIIKFEQDHDEIKLLKTTDKKEHLRLLLEEKRHEIIVSGSAKGTNKYTLNINSFLKNIVSEDKKANTESVHLSVFANNTIILEKLKLQITQLSEQLESYQREPNGGIIFKNASQEDKVLSPFIEAIQATIKEVNIANNTSYTSEESKNHIAHVIDGLYYNVSDKAAPEKENLTELVNIFMGNNTFEQLTKKLSENGGFKTGFKEAIDKTKGELHTCYSLFTKEYGEKFTILSAAEQEIFIHTKSLLYPGLKTQGKGYPDILFVGSNNQLIYSAPTKTNLNVAANFEGNQIVRHPLDIFHNMKACFGAEGNFKFSDHDWKQDNIDKFRKHINSENWKSVKKGAESRTGSENLKILTAENAEYKDFKIETHQVFAFPSETTTTKFINEALDDEAKEGVTHKELGALYAYMFGELSNSTIRTDQFENNVSLMKEPSVSNINDTQMEFYPISKAGITDKLKTTLLKVFDHYNEKSDAELEKLKTPQKEFLIMAGYINDKKYSDLSKYGVDSDFNDLVVKLKIRENEAIQAKNEAIQAKNKAIQAKNKAIQVNDAMYQSAVHWAVLGDPEALKLFQKNLSKNEETAKENLIEAYKKAKSDEAKVILLKMQEIYKPGTSKGKLLTHLKDKYNTDTVNQSVKLSDTEELAEYVISMKFAEDMEIKTVQQILESNPLSEVFSQEENQIILSTIGERSSNNGKAKTGSHEPINFKPS